jgi:hypothetical protein
MKKILFVMLAALVALSACSDSSKKEKKKKVMGEKTTVFLKEDPYKDMPRMVEVLPDSLKGTSPVNVDSTAFILELDADGQPTGKVNCRVSYSQGKVYIVENLKDGNRDSVCTAYYPNGQLWSEEHYRNGVQVGEEKAYQENGYPSYIGHYDDRGNCCGIWRYYNEKGELEKSVSVDDKTIQCGHCTKCIQLHRKKLSGGRR